MKINNSQYLFDNDDDTTDYDCGTIYSSLGTGISVVFSSDSIAAAIARASASVEYTHKRMIISISFIVFLLAYLVLLFPSRFACSLPSMRSTVS